MILAIELSTRRGSVALLDGDEVLIERAWDDAAARHLALWSHLGALLRTHPIAWPKLTAVAVGRGPGSFSGLRAGLIAARMLAAPDATPVLAVASGEALAMEWFAQNPAARHPVAVAGDARRGALWMGVFERSGQGLRQTGDWRLLPADRAASHLPPGARLLTSDRARLLAACSALGAPLADEPEERYPTAAFVGHAAARRLAGQAPRDPLEPLYLHPPV